MNRTRFAAAAAIAALAVAAMWPASVPLLDRRPNVILIVTDDQAFDTMASDAMPWLQTQVAEPGSGWTLFPNAFSSTPMCCPARATLLTGRYSFHTGVRTNLDGDEFDETNTLAVWLDEAGYTTGLIGKYLNHYPWTRGPYVPPGWDRWFAKLNPSRSTAYADFPVIDQGVPWTVRGTYATDALAEEATEFVRDAPIDRPYFLLFAPSAPHAPFIPAPRHVGSLVDRVAPPLVRLNDVDDAAPFVRRLPAIDATRAVSIASDSERARETLLAVDEALQALASEVAARGQRDRTVIFVLTDNGLSFGEHRWVGKNCPYEACVRTPLAMFVPGSIGGESQMLASNVDVAPTIAELTQTEIPATDGMSLVGSMDDATVERDGVLLTSAGRIPEWWAVRTDRWKYIAYVDGFHELYDVAGDPFELVNLADDPAVADVMRTLEDLLSTLSGGRSKSG